MIAAVTKTLSITLNEEEVHELGKAVGNISGAVHPCVDTLYEILKNVDEKWKEMK